MRGMDAAPSVALRPRLLLGKPFAYDTYQRELTELRDQLKAGLSGAKEWEGKELPPVAEVAEQIKSLRASHTVEAAPERAKSVRKATAEVPVTARIRRREVEEAPAAEALPAEAAPAEKQKPEPIIVPPVARPPAKPAWSERVGRGGESQMRLF